MSRRRIFIDGKPIEFDCELKGAQVHLTKKQLTNLFCSIGLELVTNDSQLTGKLQDKVEETSPAPVAPAEPPAEEKKDEAKAEEKKPQAGAFNDEQKKLMKDIKEKLSIKENKELNPLVYDWSVGRYNTYKDLTPENINDFVEHLKSEKII